MSALAWFCLFCWLVSGSWAMALVYSLLLLRLAAWLERHFSSTPSEPR